MSTRAATVSYFGQISSAPFLEKREGQTFQYSRVVHCLMTHPLTQTRLEKPEKRCLFLAFRAVGWQSSELCKWDFPAWYTQRDLICLGWISRGGSALRGSLRGAQFGALSQRTLCDLYPSHLMRTSNICLIGQVFALSVGSWIKDVETCSLRPPSLSPLCPRSQKRGGIVDTNCITCVCVTGGVFRMGLWRFRILPVLWLYVIYLSIKKGEARSNAV